MPFAPPLALTLRKVTPLAPMIMLRMLIPVPVVVVAVLIPVWTLSVPPPVAVKAALAPVFRVKLPVKVSVAPVLFVKEIPVPGAMLLMAPLKVTVPPVLLWTLTALAVLLVIVPPKLKLAVPPLMTTASPDAPVAAPAEIVIFPLTLVRLMLFVPPLEVREVMAAVAVPVLKEMPPLLVLMVTVCMVNVPKLVPAKAKLAALPEFPNVRPKMLLFCARVTTFPAVFVIVGLVVGGGNVVPVGGVKPEQVARSAPWPHSFCPFCRANPPV